MLPATPFPRALPPPQDEARKQAQANPRKLFEDNWVEWLTTLSKAACDEGIRQAIGVVLDWGMLNPDPESRPQTAEAAKEVLLEALDVYETEEGAGSEDGTTNIVN